MYKKLLFKRQIASLNIYFNQRCLKLGITPNYIKVKTSISNPSSLKAIAAAQKTWLKAELNKWFSARDSICTYLYLIHTRLSFLLHPVSLELLQDKLYSENSIILFKKKQTQEKKLKNLVKSQRREVQQHKIKFYDRYINTTTVSLTEAEENLLGKGFKYCIPQKPDTNKLKHLCADADIALNNFTADKHIIAKQINLQISQPLNKYSKHETNTLKSLKQKIKHNNLTITKADKGNTVVILNKSTYEDKINEFLADDIFKILPKNPTNSFQSQSKNLISLCPRMFQNNQKLHVMNPTPPRLYGLLKIHKPGSPIRPVVSYTNAPNYRISKFFNTYYKSLTNFQPKYSIKNSVDLAKKLNNLNIPIHSKLVSFDVKNLFTNIPLPDVRKIIIDTLENKNVDPVLGKEVLSVFDTCTNQNYFQYKDKFYKQYSGLPMGSPLSPLLAEIFMNNFEHTLLTSGHPLIKNIVYWYRYVDDILCLWTGTDRQLQKFLTHINSIHKCIQFTIEIENNQSINFLDLTISRLGSSHSFKIFRKDTYTDAIIPASSQHPLSHKHAAFHSMIHRLINIPLSSDNFTIELKTIKQIASNNEYNPKIIDSILHKHENKYLQKLIYNSPPSENKKYFKLIYLDQSTQLISKKISKVNHLSPALYTLGSIGSHLINCKTHVNILDKCGVYKLKCANCDNFYIGQTGTSFSKRFSQHKRDIGKGETTSAFSKHLNQFQHSCDFSKDFQILHLLNKGKKMDRLENIEINQSIKCNLPLTNDLLYVQHSPLIDLAASF